MVRELTVDKNTGLPNGRNFVDRLTHREMNVKARVVVLAAGTLESTRILLNSNLANSSGLVGRYLMDQVYGPGVLASVPEARKGNINAVMGSAATAWELADAAGFEILSKNDKPNPPGYSIHEVGTCRLGYDPKKSVLNKFSQSHDHKNLSVVDGCAVHQCRLGRIPP